METKLLHRGNLYISLQYVTKVDDEFTGTLQISKSLLYFGCAFLLLLLSCKCSGDLNDAVSYKKYIRKNSSNTEIKLKLLLAEKKYQQCILQCSLA